MKDRELVLELTKRLGLKTNTNTYLPDSVDITNDEITFGSGVGYSGFQIVFRFTPDGDLIDHGIYE